MSKSEWIDRAEVFDTWRVVPRAFFTAYFVFWGWITVTLLIWYVHLPATERTLEAAGFGSAIFLTATGFLKQIFTTYSENGRDWDNRQPQIRTEVTATTVTTQKPGGTS